jgi:hypothetical protein
MIRYIGAALCLAAFVGVSAASAADLTIESTVKDGVAIITAKTDAAVVVWIPTAGLTDLVPVDLLRDSKTRVVTGKGRFTVYAVSAPEKDKPRWAEVTFTIGTPEPPPQPPPDDKPKPVPPPPAIDLAAKLKAAYLADTSPSKRGQLVNMIGIYSAMGDHVEKDPKINTPRVLLDVLTKVKDGMLADGVLIDMRRLVAGEIASTIGPPSDLPLDRPAATALFRRIVASLPRPEYPMSKTVSVQIGNSDNKLTQEEWSKFCECTDRTIRAWCDGVHFSGGSRWDAAWQNACWVAAVDDLKIPCLQDDLTKVRKRYRQDSVAVLIGETAFI